MPRKRYRKRRRRRYRRRATVSRNLGPLRVRQKAKIIYADNFNLNPGIGGTVASYVFAANGVYDPNITGVGHQPRGFDQLMTLYDHCTVIGMKAVIQGSNRDSQYANYMAARIMDSKDTTVTPTDILENRFVKYRLLSNRNGGANNKTIILKCNPNKFLGKSNPMSCDELQNTVAANPLELAYLQIHAFSSGSSIDTDGINIRVRIEYTVIFHEPKQPPQS